ncbi:hypothetical protein SAMN05216480_101107 [Pustulibacterium marinum]|uniref:DoxX protein n=1 Tax=Pustulibacterium marinum TaxID=1224947 RepID=A0A1I7ETK2_9FLAO|nr:DoxX family protein [Pustulibacterium marinum]SFU27218.1 hypothetical protein SAMN05216480_101107 [Pustulibacterium marinum]
MHTLMFTQVAILLLFIFTFGFSAFEKITDFKGQVLWLNDYFKNSFMKHFVKLSILKILFFEIIATFLCVAGIIELIWFEGKTFALLGCLLCIAVLLALLIGTRLVKDYDGARNMVIYLIPAFFLLYLLN